MKGPSNLRSDARKGFTLLELLITLAILSVILLSVFGVFVKTVKTKRRMEARLLRATISDALFRRFAADLRGAFFLSPDDPFFDGQIDRLEFMSTVDALIYNEESQRSIGRIGYQLGRNIKKPEVFRLFRTEQIGDLNAEREYQELYSYVSDLRFRYLKHEEVSSGNVKLVKLDTWDSKGEGDLPLAVQIHITLLFPNEYSEKEDLRSLDEEVLYTYSLVIPLPTGGTRPVR